MIKAIVCVDNKFGIGKNNNLLFKLKSDMNYFKAITKNAIVMCGYNTLCSFPNGLALPGRSTIVLCSKGKEREDCLCVHTVEEFIKIAKILSITQDVWIIGGGKIYELMLPYCEQIYLTKVDIDGEADTFFPNLDLMTKEFSRKLIETEYEKGLTLQYFIYYKNYEN